MNANAAADTAVLVSAIITLVAIASKLITANLIQRSKKNYTRLDARRREVIGRLKEVQLKTTSAKGTLEFWERRRTETAQRLQDMQRDVETYEQQMGDDLPAGSVVADEEAVATEAGMDGVDPDTGLLTEPDADAGQADGDEAVTRNDGAEAPSDVAAPAAGDAQPAPRPTTPPADGGRTDARG